MTSFFWCRSFGEVQTTHHLRRRQDFHETDIHALRSRHGKRDGIRDVDREKRVVFIKESTLGFFHIADQAAEDFCFYPCRGNFGDADMGSVQVAAKLLRQECTPALVA